MFWQGPHHDAVKYRKTDLFASRASACADRKSVRQVMISRGWKNFDTPVNATTAHRAAKRIQIGLNADVAMFGREFESDYRPEISIPATLAASDLTYNQKDPKRP